MSDDFSGMFKVRSRARAGGVLALLIGAFLVVACQPAADAGESPSSAVDVASEGPADSVAAASPALEESGGDPASGEVRVTVSETTAGPALAGEDGMTLYVLFGDNEDGSGCIDACEDAWPPLTIEEGTEVVPGEGVTGEIATTTRPDGTTQVTLNFRPLYYYSGDTSPGDANGHEVGDAWFVAAQ